MFQMDQKVLFKHCDPAGIVFYPRYFEMMNDCVEAFFADALAWPFETMHPESAVPTAAISTEFTAPSRHGDRLSLTLRVERIGGASLGLSITAAADGEDRFHTRSTLVHVGAAGRPLPWPGPIRDRLTLMKDAAP